mgnify:CR=1 FL=1
MFVFQAEDGIRYLVRSRGLGDVYKRQTFSEASIGHTQFKTWLEQNTDILTLFIKDHQLYVCLLYTSDAADERSSVDLGGRRIIKKKIKVKRS